MTRALLSVLLFLGCSEARPRVTPPVTKVDAGTPQPDAGSSADTGVGAPDAGQPLVDPLSEEELRRRVTTLASDEWQGRDEGTPGHTAARAWIIEELTACGVEGAMAGGRYEQPIPGTSGVNVLGLISGSNAALVDRTIIISAHYDHLGPCRGRGICLGADDNAAGVAIAIGAACEMQKRARDRSVMVALWDAEEPPTFLSPDMGSAYYAANPIRPLANIDAVLVMDLVGGDLWPGFENHFVFGAELSPELDAALTATPPPEGVVFAIGSYHLFENTALGFRPLSDYQPFKERNIPSLFFTNGTNKNYHTPEDVIAEINFPKLVKEAQYFVAVTDTLAASSSSPTFEASGARYTRDAVAILPVMQAAVATGGMLDSLNLSITSRNSVERDVVRIEEIAGRLSAGGAATPEDISALRSATQRLNCLTGTDFNESVCGLL